MADHEAPRPVAGVLSAEHFRKWLLSQQQFTSVLFKMPRWMRWSLRVAYFAPLDLTDWITGRTDPTVPARWINFTGNVDDIAESREQLKTNLIEKAGLTPTSHVLEIGCGFGRLGVAMTSYLAPDGQYWGIDIVPRAIKWCKKHIDGPHGNIGFIHADIQNNEYNPRGRLEPLKYRFPFEDASFDIVVLISVFTHMLPPEMDHYLAEIARVLKPGGRSFISYFVITDASSILMTTPSSSMRFEYDHGDYLVMSERVPELGVAYRERNLRESYDRCGLDFTLYPGRWSQGLGPGDQDFVVGTRQASEAGRG